MEHHVPVRSYEYFYRKVIWWNWFWSWDCCGHWMKQRNACICGEGYCGSDLGTVDDDAGRSRGWRGTLTTRLAGHISTGFSLVQPKLMLTSFISCTFSRLPCSSTKCCSTFPSLTVVTTSPAILCSFSNRDLMISYIKELLFFHLPPRSTQLAFWISMIQCKASLLPRSFLLLITTLLTNKGHNFLGRFYIRIARTGRHF